MLRWVFAVLLADRLLAVVNKWRMRSGHLQIARLWYHYASQGESSRCYLQKHAFLSETFCSWSRPRWDLSCTYQLIALFLNVTSRLTDFTLLWQLHSDPATDKSVILTRNRHYIKHLDACSLTCVPASKIYLTIFYRVCALKILVIVAEKMASRH